MPECCGDCPAMAPCAPSAGIKSGLRDGKPIDGKQECLCRTCCCKTAPKTIPCYKQPKIPDSFAPRRIYLKPTAPIETTTTYNMSYLPVDGCTNVRGEARRHEANIVPSTAPMETVTVNKLSYLPNPVCVTQPLKPCSHDMWGQGPMQNITTARHDYVPKASVMRESFKPAAKVHCLEEPFENRTVNRMSYLAPDKVVPVISYAPKRCYERPAAKMDAATTHKMSYQPNAPLPKETHPWSCKGQYQPPCAKIDSSTTYGMSFLDNNMDCRRQPIMPSTGNNPVTASTRFETATVYKNSYIPTTTPVPAPVRPQPNIVPSTAQFEGDTVHKLSFLPNPVCVQQPLKPCSHDMWGQGPMQNITTQRHDFVPKPTAIRESFKPAPKMHCLEEPFENRTVNRMSFLNPGPQPATTSFAPARCYERPAAKMDAMTTQKMSYQPVNVPRPQPPPWACKGQYQKSCQKFEATTVYRGSFLPPGEDCSTTMDPCQYGDCKPCECICPAQCIATDPCACAMTPVYPKAEC